MRYWSLTKLQSLTIELLESKFSNAQINVQNISLDDDLYEKGVLDSYDVVELLSDISEKTGLEADLASTVPGETFSMTINTLSKLFYSST